MRVCIVFAWGSMSGTVELRHRRMLFTWGRMLCWRDRRSALKSSRQSSASASDLCVLYVCACVSTCHSIIIRLLGIVGFNGCSPRGLHRHPWSGHAAREPRNGHCLYKHYLRRPY